MLVSQPLATVQRNVGVVVDWSPTGLKIVVRSTAYWAAMGEGGPSTPAAFTAAR